MLESRACSLDAAELRKEGRGGEAKCSGVEG